MEQILDLIRSERERQDSEWGVQNHDPAIWQLILTDEVGEASKAVLERDDNGYFNELVQVAAVAVAALECHLRNSKR